MGILRRIKQSFLATRGGFELSSSNGLPHAYALLRAKGEGGNSDPEVEPTRSVRVVPASIQKCRW